MRSAREQARYFHSSGEYFVLHVSKDRTLPVAGLGVLAILFLVVIGGTKEEKTHQEVSAGNTSLAAPALAPAPADYRAVGTGPGSSASAEREIEPVPTRASRAGDERFELSPAAPTTTTVSQNLVKFYPSPVAIPYPAQADALPANDSTADQPADSPPPNPDATPNAPAASSDDVRQEIIKGAGTTRESELYEKWFKEFERQRAGVEFGYQAVGSGAGIRRLLAHSIDFGASDVPMSDEQLAAAKGAIVHIPSVINGVVPIYNVPGVTEIRFNAEILAGIYSGKIIYWNDRAILAANRGMDIPAFPITAIHRSDGCGATFVLTDFLSKVSREWQETLGRGASVNWLVGLGGKGNEGVAALVKQAPGAIGYVEYVYAVQNQVPFGSVGNGVGKFIKANLTSLRAAAASLDQRTTEFPVSITHAPGAEAYPMASFTWLLAPTHSRSKSEEEDLVAFLGWMLSGEPQNTASRLGYAPLPEGLRGRVYEEIRKIR